MAFELIGRAISCAARRPPPRQHTPPAAARGRASSSRGCCCSLRLATLGIALSMVSFFGYMLVARNVIIGEAEEQYKLKGGLTLVKNQYYCSGSEIIGITATAPAGGWFICARWQYYIQELKSCYLYSLANHSSSTSSPSGSRDLDAQLVESFDYENVCTIRVYNPSLKSDSLMPLDWETRENGGAQLSLIESAPEKDQIKTLIDLVNRETKDQKWTPLMVVDFDGREQTEALLLSKHGTPFRRPVCHLLVGFTASSRADLRAFIDRVEERGGFRLYGALRIGQKVWPFGRPESQEKGDAEKGEEAKEEKKEEKGYDKNDVEESHAAAAGKNKTTGQQQQGGRFHLSFQSTVKLCNRGP